MKHQVLLVDDEPAIVDGLRVALRREPFATHGATSAAEALALMERVPIDVVLSDEEMPGTAGSELLARVRERHPDTVRVILTGRGSLTAAIRAINEGAIFKYLTKPCSPAEVASTLRAALAERHAAVARTRALESAQRQRALIEELHRAYTSEAPDAPALSLPSPALPPAPAPVEAPMAAPMAAPLRPRPHYGSLDPKKVATLTPRERDILSALASGQHVKDIAQDLDISTHTARNHMKAILRKLDVHSQIELLAKLVGREV
jgi:DNA-binding NarL/FixJ family response regulator